jgi:beta-glucosidase-like glycosyl hydrolase
MFDEMHNKMKGEDPEKVEKLIEEAIRGVRKKKITSRAQKK